MYIYLDMVAEFSCEMCGQCCRNDWQVTVDKESYQRNEEFFTRQGKGEEFAQAFVPLKDTNSLGEYAYIAKGPRGGCCFLAEENFCHLHREAGHEHLDTVCQTFPRYPMNTARGLEVTLSFNCPAVFARINRVAPLQVIRSAQAPCAVSSDSIAVHVFPTQQGEEHPLHYYFELEQHFIDIIQWRSLTMVERLQFLRRTVEEINQLRNKEEVPCGQALNRIFHKNYTALDATEGEMPQEAGVTSEILVEHFLVNIIFQKNFYTYGLLKGMELLEGFWQRWAEASAGSGTRDEECIKTLIMDMAFQHNHHRLR